MEEVRESSPDALTGAEITGSGSAWVGFAGSVPDHAVETIVAFQVAHETVTVDVLVDQGFTELELEQAIAIIHYSVFEASGVREATTSFDFDTRHITSVFGSESDMKASVDEVRADAIDHLRDAGLGEILDHVELSVSQSPLPAFGGSDDNTKAIGGEDINLCTSGFSLVTGGLGGGISTAGHCENAQSDDGIPWVHKADHEGVHGDFQWHTTPQLELDDFYSGDAGALEVNRRDVAAVGAPVVGAAMCKNGVVGFRDCGEVIQLNVCHFQWCNLVQMDARRATPGDSGGPVYFGNTAYGLHKGWRWDPAPPFSRDLFARADRIDNAFPGITVAH